LFDEPKHKWLAKIITFKTPSQAERAAERLIKALKRGRLGKLKIGRKRALQIDQALNKAANMAEASAKRENLSKKEKQQLKKIAKIYRRAQRQASKIYKQKYRGS